MVDPVEREVTFGDDLLDPSLVSDRYPAIVEIVAPPRFVEVEHTYKDADKRIAAAREEGKSDPESFATFKITELRWKVRQHYPAFEDAQDREWRFRLSLKQANAMAENQRPQMNPKSVLGALVEQCERAELPSPQAPSMQGLVIVTESWSEEGKDGFQTRRYDIISHLGDRNSFDLEAGQKMVDDGVNTKQTAAY